MKAGSSQSLLQIPHFNEEAVKHCARGNQPIKDILAFLNREKEQRRGVAHMTETELLDVDEFCRHMTQIDVETKCEVEGEKMICKVGGHLLGNSLEVHRPEVLVPAGCRCMNNWSYFEKKLVGQRLYFHRCSFAAQFITAIIIMFVISLTPR